MLPSKPRSSLGDFGTLTVSRETISNINGNSQKKIVLTKRSNNRKRDWKERFHDYGDYGIVSLFLFLVLKSACWTRKLSDDKKESIV